MALSSGDAILKRAGWVTLESSGASTSAGAMTAVATTECTASNHEDAPWIILGIEAAFGANTPDEGALIEIYAKINTITGVSAEDGNVPTTAHKHKFLDACALKASSGTQYVTTGLIALPGQEFNLYLLNGDSTDAMTWQLYMQPVSIAPKA